jgi:MFS family permease
MTRKIHYAWMIALLTFLALLASAGVRNVAAIMIKPLNQELGWSTTDVSLAIMISLFLFGFGGALGGTLVDRFGPRRVMIVGLLTTAIGVALTQTMTELWQLWLYWGVIAGIGTGIVTNVLSSAIALRWFTQYRGLVIGGFGAAAAAGQLIFLPLLISISGSMGWRSVFTFMAVVVMVVFVPVLLFLRNSPKDLHIEPLGGELPPAQFSAESKKTSLREAIRTRDFWLLAFSFFICGYTTNGMIQTHLLPHAIEHGFAPADISWSLALMGAMNILGTLASGWLSDRYDNRKLLALYYGFRGISLAGLPFILDMQGMLIFAIIYGLDWVATVPPTVNLCAERFGRGSVGTIYGWVFCSHMIGAGIGSFAGGFFRDMLGDYHLVFITAAILGLVASFMSLNISISAHKAKLKVA